jgi:hypothetical protein
LQRNNVTLDADDLRQGWRSVECFNDREIFQTWSGSVVGYILWNLNLNDVPDNRQNPRIAY